MPQAREHQFTHRLTRKQSDVKHSALLYCTRYVTSPQWQNQNQKTQWEYYLEFLFFSLPGTWYTISEVVSRQELEITLDAVGSILSQVIPVGIWLILV